MRIDVLEEFAEVHYLVDRVRPAEIDQWAQMQSIQQPVESLRRSYRHRQQRDGLCRSCPKPLSPESRSWCDEHLKRSRARALASWRRKSTT